MILEKLKNIIQSDWFKTGMSYSLSQAQEVTKTSQSDELFSMRSSFASKSYI